jgi:hypothetical protein
MTSDCRRSANQANAKASTGPKTRAGKARSSKNAVRHGLSIPIWSDPTLAPQAEAIALRIAGPDAEGETMEWARRIGGAQADLMRARARRKELIERLLADPDFQPPTGKQQQLDVTKHTKEHERDVKDLPVKGIGQAQLSPEPLELDQKLSAIINQTEKEMIRLDRYGRRALSRRKFAIRQYDNLLRTRRLFLR